MVVAAGRIGTARLRGQRRQGRFLRVVWKEFFLKETYLLFMASLEFDPGLLGLMRELCVEALAWEIQITLAIRSS